MSAEIRRRSLLRAALAGGVALGLGGQAIATVTSGRDRSQHPMQPSAADDDTRAVLLRYAGEFGGYKGGGRGRP
jgi:hypothetical protein